MYKTNYFSLIFFILLFIICSGIGLILDTYEIGKVKSLLFGNNLYYKSIEGTFIRIDTQYATEEFNNLRTTLKVIKYISVFGSIISGLYVIKLIINVKSAQQGDAPETGSSE